MPTTLPAMITMVKEDQERYQRSCFTTTASGYRRAQAVLNNVDGWIQEHCSINHLDDGFSIFGYGSHFYLMSGRNPESLRIGNKAYEICGRSGSTHYEEEFPSKVELIEYKQELENNIQERINKKNNQHTLPFAV